MINKPLAAKALPVLLALGAIGSAVGYTFFDDLAPIVGRWVNRVRTVNAPAGTLSVEQAPGRRVSLSAPPAAAAGDGPGEPGWPSFNRSLTSERFAPLDQIDVGNVGELQVLCEYDTKQHTSFQTGPIVVGNAMIGTTEHDIFSIDAETCEENWRTHEPYKPAGLLAVNRGAAYLDGRLFRGTQDGRVLAYDFKTGKRLWATTVADPALGETTPAAPIAWNGLVFIGNAGGDNKGVKGRMYALDAASGRIKWEFFLVPRGPEDRVRGPQGHSPLDRSTWRNASGTPITGGATWTSYTLDPATGVLHIPGGNPAPDFAAGPRGGDNLYSGSVVMLDALTGRYVHHHQLVPADWHDWDVSGAPTLISTRAGRAVLAVAPKDGYLYAFDRRSNALLYKTPVTRRLNDDAPFTVGKDVRFCPGAIGGAEWNGPAYDPRTNLLLVGQVDWCWTVRMQADEDLAAVKPGQPWFGMDTNNPYHLFGRPDPTSTWGGWVYAVDADTGDWAWRARLNYPVLSGMTPTGGGVVYFGDVGGNFYVLDARNGKRLWGRKIGGAIGGGVITYTTRGVQRVAAAVGFTSILWPTEVTTGKIVILGLPRRTDARSSRGRTGGARSQSI